jgi:hypothetical protein
VRRWSVPTAIESDGPTGSMVMQSRPRRELPDAAVQVGRWSSWLARTCCSLIPPEAEPLGPQDGTDEEACLFGDCCKAKTAPTADRIATSNWAIPRVVIEDDSGRSVLLDAKASAPTIS